MPRPDELEAFSDRPERLARASHSLQVLARKIRQLREREGLTQEEFASRTGISVSFASLLERGERSPSYETLVAIAETLQLSLSELFREAGGEPNAAFDDPYFARLTETARRLKLTRIQVDKLVGVAEVLFAPTPGETTAPEGPVCSEPDCGRPVLAKSLCGMHYHRARRGKL